MAGIRLGGITILQAVYVPLASNDSTLHYISDITVDPGQDPTQRTTPTANVIVGPILHPDGSKILFSHTGNLVEIAVDGSPGDEVTIWDGATGVTGFAYSADGNTIVFTVSDVTDRKNLYTIVSDGTDQSGNETVLYTDPSSRQVCGAAYNFDGSKIGFHVLLSATSLGIWVVNADGSGATQLSTSATVGSGVQFDQPIMAWLRTQSRLVWNNGPLATPVWKAMDDDGTNVVTLATLASGDGRPTWHTISTDDAYIYRRPASGGGVVNRVALDGSGDSLFISPLPANAANAQIRAFGGRVYWDSSDNIISCFEDATDERDETASSAVNYGLLA